MTAASRDRNIITVDCSDDILAVTARHIIDHAGSLPDLTRTVVLLPDLQFAPRLRLQLLQAAADSCSALLGPVINTPGQWLDQNFPLEQTIPGRARRELILVEVLKQHPGVFQGSDPWQLAASLVTLFDELTLNRVSIADDLAEFTAQLQSAYGIDDRLPAPLGMEAGMVHSLWQAWHQQLQAADMLDPGMACLQRLAMHTAHDDALHYYLTGFDTLSSAETEWLTSLLDSGRAHVICYQQTPVPDSEQLPPLQALLQSADTPATISSKDPVSRSLNAILVPDKQPPPQRARALRAEFDSSPLADRLGLLAASSAEQEAQAIDLQVRQWLLDGRQPVAIVTEDRRLARRVRALLERAGIQLKDTGGWALSTTSAAAALERWLETVEEDFDHLPLLDILKSPFSFPADDQETFRNLVYRFEQDIVLHENIGRGLSRYRHHVELRRQRLPDGWTSGTADALQQLLNRLDQAAEPLREYLDMAAVTPAVLLDHLRSSLEELGMWSAFGTDPAGRRIQQEWQLLRDAAHHSTVEMNWREFRAWLGAALERHDFRPTTTDSPVLLMTLQQAQLGQYAGLVIGACDREHLPASPPVSPFFNEPYRWIKGQLLRPDHYQLQLQRFQRLLTSAPSVLLTWPGETNGEPHMPGPWVDALQTFHRLVWQQELTDSRLQQLLNRPDTRVAGHNPLPTPAPAGYPAASLPAELLPETLSVSAHGSLIDCPYQFFAAWGLGLRPRDVIKEALEKADYGELIHLCLELFHAGRDSWPGPFSVPLTTANREAAIALLAEITRTVFARKVEDNFEHRAWQHRWQALIPAYIDWQIGHQQEWTFQSAEDRKVIELANGRSLKGRLDRIDTSADGSTIIDYKTGTPPKQPEIDSGEKVQLPSYALLTDSPPSRVEYLKLDPNVATGAVLEGDALDTLAPALQQHRVSVLDAMRGPRGSATLPRARSRRTD